MKKILISGVVIVLVIPQVALASWWNPLSWKIFNKPAEVGVEQSYRVNFENKNTTTTATSTAKISHQKVATVKENKNSVISTPKKQTEPNIQKEQLLEVTRSQENRSPEISTYPGTALIEAFIKTQSQDSFREFCNAAKTITGHGGTIQVFNGDRTALVNREKTLYEEVTSCALFVNEDSLGRGKNYLWTTNPNELLLELNDSDSDTTRKIKLQYNSNIKAIMPNTLVGYIAPNGMTPNEALLADYQTLTYSYSHVNDNNMRRILRPYLRPSFAIPRNELTR